MRLTPVAALALITTTATAQAPGEAVRLTFATPVSGQAEVAVTLRNDTGAPIVTLREDVAPGTQALRVTLPPLPRSTHSVQAGLIEDGRVIAQGAVQTVAGHIGLDFEMTLHEDLAVGFSEHWECDNGQTLSLIRTDTTVTITRDDAAMEFRTQDQHFVAENGDTLRFVDNRAELRSGDMPPDVCAPALFPPLLPVTAVALEGSWQIGLDRRTAQIVVPGLDGASLAETGLAVTARRDGTVRVSSAQLTLDMIEGRCRIPRTGLLYPFTATLDAHGTDTPPAGCAGDPLALLAGPEWQVTRLLGWPIGLSTNSALTLKLVDDRISGRTTCNRYLGTARVEAGQLALRDFGTTRLACPTGLRNIEMRFLDAMEAATSFDLSPSGQLTLNAGPMPVLTAIRQTAP